MERNPIKNAGHTCPADPLLARCFDFNPVLCKDFYNGLVGGYLQDLPRAADLHRESDVGLLRGGRRRSCKVLPVQLGIGIPNLPRGFEHGVDEPRWTTHIDMGIWTVGALQGILCIEAICRTVIKVQMHVLANGPLQELLSESGFRQCSCAIVHFERLTLCLQRLSHGHDWGNPDSTGEKHRMTRVNLQREVISRGTDLDLASFTDGMHRNGAAARSGVLQDAKDIATGITGVTTERILADQSTR